MSLLSEQEFACPYCASHNQISLDDGARTNYELVTDCEICCRPIVIRVTMAGDDCVLDVRAENG